MSDRLKHAALSEAISNLRSQKEDLRNVRSQSAFSATISSIIASVFASMISGRDLDPLFSGLTILGVNFIFWVSILSFGASLYFSIIVLTAVKDVTFEPNPDALLYWADSSDDEIDGIGKIVEQLTGDFSQNEEVIESVRSDLQLALIFGAVQIIPWMMVVASVGEG